MVNNEVNIMLAYLWMKFYSTVDAGKMQRNSTLHKEKIQIEIMQAEKLSRSSRKAETRLSWYSRRQMSLITYLLRNENNIRLFKNKPVSSGIIEGLTNIGGSFSRKPNTITNTSQ